MSDTTPQGQEESPSFTPPGSVDELLQVWSGLPESERQLAFRLLPREDAEELFLGLNAHDQAELFRVIPTGSRRSWIRLLAPDDSADLVQELDEAERETALALLDEATRREVSALLAYAEDEAGGLMNVRYARLRPEMSLDEAIRYLRVQAQTQVETIYYAYVLEPDQRLLGAVSFRDLFSAAGAEGKRVRDIMRTDLVTVREEMDQEQVGQLFSKHDLIAIPVVDADRRIKGIVTVDDIVSVVQEEATEDIQKLGGTEALGAPYLKLSWKEMLKKRGGWLTVLFVGEMFTATAMGYYEKEIANAVVLALFIPLIISSGGNSGSQASTLIIRAIALEEVRLRDWWRVLYREIGMGLSLGILLGSIGFLRILLWPGKEKLYGPHYVLIGATVCASLVGVVLWGALAGSMLPFVLRKLRFDPASASAPLVATLVDVTGLVIYFTVAHFLLVGTVL